MSGEGAGLGKGGEGEKACEVWRGSGLRDKTGWVRHGSGGLRDRGRGAKWGAVTGPEVIVRRLSTSRGGLTGPSRSRNPVDQTSPQAQDAEMFGRAREPSQAESVEESHRGTESLGHSSVQSGSSVEQDVEPG